MILAAQCDRSPIQRQHEVRVVMGGPVTPLFQARTGLPLQWISFSQRRRRGYRETYEFDKKRVLVADSVGIQIFGYSQDEYRPYPIVSYSVCSPQSAPDGTGLRQGQQEEGKDDVSRASTIEPISEEVSVPKDSSQSSRPSVGPHDQPTQETSAKPRHTGSDNDEEILFAGFLSDYDPSLVLIVTYQPSRRTSYLKLLKIEPKDDGGANLRRYTFREDEDKRELVEKVRNNLIQCGVDTKITKQLSLENTEVKIDTDK